MLISNIEAFNQSTISLFKNFPWAILTYLAA